MIDNPLVVHCPICGCPLSTQGQLPGTRVSCSRCMGQFALGTPNEIQLEAVAVLAAPKQGWSQAIGVRLSEIGFRTVFAQTAHQAIKLCLKYHATLLVADINLPDQNAWLMASKLRIVDSNVKIWLCTESPTEFDRCAARHLPVDAFAQSIGGLHCLFNSWRTPDDHSIGMRVARAPCRPDPEAA